MRTIKDKFAQIIELHRNEDIPEQLIKTDNSSAVVKIDDQLLQIKNNPVFSSLSEFKTDNQNEFIDKVFGELKHTTTTPEILRENFDQYKISLDVFRYAMKYVREQFKSYGAESAILLMLNTKTKDWQLLPVLQTGEHASVNYYRPLPKEANLDKNKFEDEYKEIFKNKDYWNLMAYSLEIYKDLQQKGYVLFGSIHSHADFEAFHSGVDDADEIDFDGLHITIGHVNKDFSYSARWIVSEIEVPKDILEVVDAPDLDTLSANIDSVKIKKKDLDLFVKDLKVQTYTYKYPYSNRYGYNQHGFNKYNIEPKYYKRSDFYDPDYRQDYDEKERQEWLHGPLHGVSDAPTLEEPTMFETSSQRLYDLVEDMAFWIDAAFYRENKELFPDDRYLELDDPPLPEKKINKAKKHLMRTKGQN